MSSGTPTLIRHFKAGAAVAAHRIVKFDSDDDHAIQGAAATDLLMGITDRLGAANAGDPLDVHVAGIAPVEYGGNVTRGQLLTSDNVGRAVAAAPSAGTKAQVIGRAWVSGASGDIGACLISQGQITEPAAG
jgi:hypothetical protein